MPFAIATHGFARQEKEAELGVAARVEGGDARGASQSEQGDVQTTAARQRYFGVAEFPSHREYLLPSERGAQSRRSFGAQQDYKVEKEAATDNDTTADSASVGGEAAEAAQKKAEEDAAAEEEAANEVPTTIPPYPTPPHPSQRFPPTTYYLLPTTYYLPRTTYYLLPTTYYLLPTGRSPTSTSSGEPHSIMGPRGVWSASHPIPSHPIPFHPIPSQCEADGKKPHTRGAIAVEGVTEGTRSDWDQVGTGSSVAVVAASGAPHQPPPTSPPPPNPPIPKTKELAPQPRQLGRIQQHGRCSRLV